MKHFRFLLSALIAVHLPFLSVSAQEAERADEPAPSSVRDIEDPFERGWRPRKYAGERREFLKDGHVALKPRTYYFNRDKADGTRSRAWALGGSVEYESGWWKEFLSVGAELYDAEKLHGESDEDGTLLLRPGQRGYTVLGKAYVTLRSENHDATFYRQTLDQPYVNKQDSRMTPNTFEAYTLKGTLDGEGSQRINYIAGYVDRMKKRNTDEFVDMAEVAGVSGTDKGLIMSGVHVQLTDDFAFGAINHYVDDVLNIAYAATDFTLDVNDELGLRLESQFTHQSSVGDDLLTGSDFDTYNAGARIAASYRNAMLKFAVTTTDDEQEIRSPYGSYPGYLSLMQKDFNRAGEDAWLIGASYNFERLGLSGLSAFVNYAEGQGAKDTADGSSLPDQSECDITADYRMKEGWAEGLWIRVRWSTLDIDGEAEDQEDFRVVLNYEIPVF